jgi:hypothetical protein
MYDKVCIVFYINIVVTGTGELFIKRGIEKGGLFSMVSSVETILIGSVAIGCRSSVNGNSNLP